MNNDRAIAIVGMGCAFPKAHSPEAFWELVRAGGDAVETVPAARWGVNPKSLLAEGEPSPDRVYTLSGCFVDHQSLAIDYGDLHVNQDFMAGLDPLFKVGLYAAQQAWLDCQTQAIDLARTGVLIGNIVLPSDSSSALCRESVGKAFADQVLGEKRERSSQRLDPRNRFAAGLPAGIIAQALGLGGACATLDAACASSLYAIQRAAEMLRDARADVMISGGLSRPDNLYTQMGFSQLRALSAKGWSSPFDQTADGLIVGEGAGFFVLKRLADALEHGDRIHGVLAGVGLSNDRDGSLLAPASEGQLRAMHLAYREADWQPHQVDMIECHATGTPLGDRIEFESLKALWQDAEPDKTAVIGSVKSNVGHLLTAAGAASLMKVLLAMRHETLPPTARFKSAASNIPLAASPFRVLKKPEPWPSKAPRCAAVSAFGFGGINAHLLVSQWKEGRASVQALSPKNTREPIAVVGLASRFGSANNELDLARIMLGLKDEVPSPRPLEAMGLDAEAVAGLKGFPITDLDIEMGAFRIPPNEMKEMLPQQLLMLILARKALQDAKLMEADLSEAGVFLGIGLDPNTANFQLRWHLQQQAETWQESLQLNLDEAESKAWVERLKANLGPALNANRVIGALGGMVASRLAREFRIGGPSFTLSSEETSGLVAVEAGIRALRENRINIALTGAVDFACDARNAMHWHRETGLPTCDGGAVLVLKRFSDAKREGNTVYAILEGVGSANGGTGEAQEATLATATNRAKADAEASQPMQSVNWSDQMSNHPLGHAGSANGMLELVASLLALHHRVLPGSGKPHYWLRNRNEGARRAVVQTLGVDGTAMALQLAEADPESTTIALRPFDYTLFCLGGANVGELTASLQELERLLAREENLVLAAKAWWQSHDSDSPKWRLAMVAKSIGELNEAIAVVSLACKTKPEAPETDSRLAELILAKSVCFSREPGIDPNSIAFVFPGSGSQFPGMGRLLSLHFPSIFDAQDRLTGYFRDQLRPDLFWSPNPTQGFEDQHRALLSAQVALGVTSHDLMVGFGVRPKGIIGYSLGESSGLFATRAWADRDKMHLQTQNSRLFSHQLAGPCEAVQQSWGLASDEMVDWTLGVVNRPVDEVRHAIADRERVYLLIVNTPNECVIGGQRQAVNAVVDHLKARFFPLHGVVTVHCEVLAPAEQDYYAHHLFETHPPAGIDFFSGGWGRKFEVSREGAADAILQQAKHGVDFPKTIQAAYAEGYQTFIEMGPGSSCTRMIGKILEGQPHHAISISKPGPRAIRHVLRALAQLFALGLPIDLDLLFRSETGGRNSNSQVARMLTIAIDRTAKSPPPNPVSKTTTEKNMTVFQDNQKPSPEAITPSSRVEPLRRARGHEVHRMASTAPLPSAERYPNLDRFAEVAQADLLAHETYLKLNQQQTNALAAAASFQLALMEQDEGVAQWIDSSDDLVEEIAFAEHTPTKSVAFDRDLCLEFATGSIAAVLGPEFEPIDSFPTRVRLPDEPLMLVDRILSVEGERMKHGRVVTEHDVKPNGWYLDGGRIPTCIAVEAGQADLFLSAYLGIDFETKGVATYRLLDAEVTFHGELPRPGEVIHYDIQIDHFFRQGKTYLFRFRFDGTVNGLPLLTMRNGCAGFFSEAELEAGKGIVRLAPKPYQPKNKGNHAKPFLPMVTESYDDAQIRALRAGDLATCFGRDFQNLPLHQPMTLPDGAMNLVDRVLTLEPEGGPFGLGFIRAEADIHPDDWFLICHFVDDKVMPGTLMYECCLHSLRIFLMRMGWLGETGEIAYQPVVGVASQLKCRGQVLETTRKVRYEIMIKELGYGPEPYAIVDALMYSDAKCIVEIGDMSLRITGLTKDKLQELWQNRPADRIAVGGVKPALFDTQHILAFAVGKPSEAFGEPYRVFDSERVIARLPGPPLMLVDRITDIRTPAWKVQAGGSIQAQYDVPFDAWYFGENRQDVMPFAVLLEIALQPCGWMAGYMGSALTSDMDLKFRNLGGSATLLRQVRCTSGTLTIDIVATKVSSSGGMIIQNYDFVVRDRDGIVYRGDTYFGFFSKAALATQVGVRDAKLIDGSNGQAFPYPQQAPFPTDRMRMLDRISCYQAKGGSAELGFIEGELDVDVEAWFFKAHFYQDPVVPGSLGLESFLQLLKVVAQSKWDLPETAQFESTAVGKPHRWEYRGQIIPSQHKVRVQAHITAIDDELQILTADGYLAVDGTVIYQIQDFSIRIC